MRYSKIALISLTVLLLSNLLIPIEDVLAVTTFVDSFDISGEETNPLSMAFNTDGTKMFVTGDDNAEVIEYNCTAFDVSTCVDAGDSLDVSGEEANPAGLAFNTDGTKMFVAGDDSGEINEYDCTAFDVSTCTNNAGANDLDISGEDATPVGLAFNTDGTKMFVAGDDNTEVIEYNCLTGFDVSTCTDADDALDVSSEIDNTFRSIAFSSSGTTLFILDSGDGEVNQYSLTTGFDVSTATFVNFFDTSATATNGPSGIAFSTDGLKMFLAGGDEVATADVFEYTLEITFDLFSSPATTSSSGGGSDSRHKTKPTFGLDHNTFKQLVEGGFSFNGIPHDIIDSFWTPFEEQEVKIGKTNTFAVKVFADKKLRVQEFLFGIPQVGDAHKAELGIEVFYNYDGTIEKVKVIQKSDIIDESIKVTTSKSKCISDDLIERCVTTLLSMKFLEPLLDKVMAIKAIDFKGRVLITYLNEGFDISGNSLNPMKTLMIPGTEKHEGLVEVTQTAKYSDFWTSQDGREFERNESGSFKQINQSFDRHMDTGVMKNRLHSEFSTLKQFQADLAFSMMPAYYRTSINYEESFSEINNIFAYKYPETLKSKLDNLEMQKNMQIESEKAQKIMEHLLDPILHLK